MDITLYHGYPDLVGKRSMWAGYGSPGVYATGGVSINILAYQYYIDSVDSSGILSVSGNYWGRAIPSGKGPRATWKFKLYAVGSFTEVTNATDLSAETFVLSGKGGTY